MASSNTETEAKIGNVRTNVLSKGIQQLLFSYTRGINKRMERTGSLFSQNTKSKCLTDEADYKYPLACFHYIHQNPLKAGLVSRMEDWEYSSFSDYAGMRNGTLCSRKVVMQFIDIDETNFMKDSYAVIDQAIVERLL